MTATARPHRARQRRLSVAFAATVLLATLGAAAQERPPRGEGGGDGDGGGSTVPRARVSATAKLELPAGVVRVIYPLLPASGPDHTALLALGDGEVMTLTRSMAVKLSTEPDLRFAGGAVARAGNVAAGYPGVYSLWLRRRGEGWALVLNREPDIWGTMRDPAADVAEAPVVHSRIDGSGTATFTVSLPPSEDGGAIVVEWGGDRWEADFATTDAKSSSSPPAVATTEAAAP